MTLNIQAKSEILRRDKDLVLVRTYDDQTNAYILKLRAVSEPPPTRVLEEFNNEYALRGELDPVWAVVPQGRRMEHQPALLLDDPGSDLLANQIGMPWETAQFLRVAIGLCRAVGELHKRTLIHRNIKPDNVFVDILTGRCWLTGFGMTIRAFGPQSERAARIRTTTFAYMSPEQTDRVNRIVDFRSDLYSLGVTLYQTLTGRLPFNAILPQDWIHCHIASEPIDPREYAPATSGPIVSIISKLMAKTPEERYQTAAGAIADLERCLSSIEADFTLDNFPLGKYDVSERIVFPQKLYGRSDILTKLTLAFDEGCRNRKSQVVFVSGSPGIGKSSVLKELQQHIRLIRSYFAFAKCEQSKTDIPYSALAEVMQQLVRQTLSGSDYELREWCEAFKETIGANGHFVVELVPEVEMIVGKHPQISSTSPRDAKNRVRRVFRQFFELFVSNDRPLALFFDDIQWADKATLTFLKDVISENQFRNLFLVIGYRNNRDTYEEFLTTFVDQVHHHRHDVTAIEVGALPVNIIEDFLADTLHSSAEGVHELATVIHEQAEGNPFFTVQLITELADARLLWFEQRMRQWRWDVEKIRRSRIGDDVIQLITAKLNRLTTRAHYALQQLSCIGNSASLRTLTLLLQMSESECKIVLREAIDAELLLHSECNYRFVHDRVEEFSYDSIDPNLRSQYHITVARQLNSSLPEEYTAEDLFVLVSQFNRGLDHVLTESERVTVVRLNVEAGTKAHRATAYTSAKNYFAVAATLLGPAGWKDRYDEMLSIYLDLAECECLIGNFSVADSYFKYIFDHVKNKLDRVKAYARRMKLYQVAGKYRQGVDVALAALRLFDFILPDLSATEAMIADEHKTLTKEMTNCEIEDLLHLGPVSDPNIEAVIDLLMEAVPCVYIAEPNLFPLFVLKAVNLSIRNGNTRYSSFAYSLYAGMLVSDTAEIDSAFRISEMALRLNDRTNYRNLRGTLLHLHGDHIHFWRKPFSTGIPILREGYSACLEAGDFVYGGFLAFQTVWQLLEKGDPLSEVATASIDYAEFLRQSHNETVFQTMRIEQQFIAALQGKTSDPTSLSTTDFDEVECLKVIEAANFGCGICFYHIAKLILAFLHGDLHRALEAANNVKSVADAVRAMPIQVTYHFYHALTLTALYESASPSDQVKFSVQLETILANFRLWADSCPQNFLSRRLLIEAELFRTQGRGMDAMQAYEAAITSARDNGLIHNEALACDLAARFYAKSGITTFADYMLGKARCCYQLWGATAIANQLKLDATTSSAAMDARTGESYDISTDSLDIAAVAAASQAVSSEMVLEKLLDTLMRLMVQNAGAERGVLALSHGFGYQEAAEAVVDRTGGVRIWTKVESDKSVPLPNSLIKYVLRTRRLVHLEDCAVPSQFSADPYIMERRPRSVLCVPLTKPNALVGFIYLENTLAPRVFTAARLTVVNILAAQAAISLDNADLYASVRRAEEAVRRSENELRLIIDTIPALVWSAQPDGALDFLNQRWLAYTGLPLEDIRQWSWITSGVVYDADLLELLAVWERVRLSGEPGQAEARLRNAEGEYRWHIIRTVPLRDADGTLLKWWGLNTDIDTQKRTDAMISGEKRLLEMIVSGANLESVLNESCLLHDALSQGAFASIMLLSDNGRALTRAAAPNISEAFTSQVENYGIKPLEGPNSAAASSKQLVIWPDHSLLFSSHEIAATSLRFGYLASWAMPILSSDGQVLGTIGIYSNLRKGPSLIQQEIIQRLCHLASIVIERNRSMNTLRRSEERYALAVEAANDGHFEWVVATNEFYASPRFMRMCGLNEQLASAGRKAILKRIPFDPSERKENISQLTKHLFGQKARFELEFRLLIEGGVRWVYLTGLCSRDENNQLIRWNGAISDITERKHAESALRESEERFALAVAGSHQGIFDWDRSSDGVFLSHGAQTMLGLLPGDQRRPLREWTSLVLVHPEDRIASWRSVRSHLRNHSNTYDVECRLILTDGNHRWIRHRGVALRDDHDKVYRMAGSFEDITERKKAASELAFMERQLRHAQRLEAMGTLAGGVAHDFNNILGAILGYGEMALEETRAKSRVRGTISNIIAAGERGRALIDRVLVFSRSSVGERVPVPIQNVAIESLRFVKATLPSGIRLFESLQADKVMILGDDTQIHQILSNLSSNAIFAMGSCGTLGISLSVIHFDSAFPLVVGAVTVGDYVALEVEDTGTGIPQKVMDRMFDPFFTTKEVGIGTGLGLSMVHSIVSDLGGAIDVKSELGKGSKFQVLIPVSAGIPKERTTQDRVLKRGSGQTIMIVEDDAQLLKLVVDNVKLLGYTPVPFLSSVEALETFCTRPGDFAALVTDGRMPQLSGSDLVREVRNVRPELPILLVSGYLGRRELASAKAAGVSEILKKPVLKDELASALSRLFANKKERN